MNHTLTADNTSRTVQVQGINIHYHEAGDGAEVLVLLHGTGPGASAWGNFQINMAALAARYRVLAIDMPHFGKSDKPLTGYMDAHWYASVVADTLDALGIEQVHMLGNSVGGSVALELALARPEMIDRLILMGTAGSLPMFSPMPTEGAKNLMAFYQGDGPTRAKMETFLRSLIFDQSRITPEFIEERFVAATVPELLVHREMDMSWMTKLWRKVDQVKHQTLIINGRDDRVVPWDTALLLLRLMPNADLHVFGRCGHWTQWERAPEFNTVVLNFLA